MASRPGNTLRSATRRLIWCSSLALLVACSIGGGEKSTRKPASRSATALEHAISTQCTSKHWVGAWRAAPSDAQQSFQDQTLRMVIAPPLEGGTMRVRLSNRFGSGKLGVSAVTIGIRASGASVRPGTTKPVVFDGHRATLIPAGARVISDPVRLDVKQSDGIAVTL